MGRKHWKGLDLKSSREGKAWGGGRSGTGAGREGLSAAAPSANPTFLLGTLPDAAPGPRGLIFPAWGCWLVGKRSHGPLRMLL